MLSFRRETDYALQLLKVLKKSKTYVSLHEVSEKTGISFLFLQKIARKLRLAKIIGSVHGINGGYKLLKPAKTISLRQIVSAVEGDCCLVPCLGAGNKCSGSCANLKGQINKINLQMLKMLDKIKLSNL